MNSLLASIIVFFVGPIIGLIIFIFIIYVILSWLFMLNIVSPQNPTARQVYGILASVVDPIVGPFRKLIPPLGNFDMGFLFAFMLLLWIQRWLIPNVLNVLAGA